MSKEKKEGRKPVQAYFHPALRKAHAINESQTVIMFDSPDGDVVELILSSGEARRLCCSLYELQSPAKSPAAQEVGKTLTQLSIATSLIFQHLQIMHERFDTLPYVQSRIPMTPELLLSWIDQCGRFTCWIACQEGDVIYRAIQKLRDFGKITVEEGVVLDSNGKKLCGHYGLRRKEGET